MKKIVYLTLIIAMISLNGFSQFSLTGEFRPRGEFRHGYKQLSDDSLRKDPAVLISQRTRLNLNYSAEKYKVGLSLQDVRLWGDQIPKEDVASTAVYQAWLAYKLCDSLWIKMGRQEIFFDDKVLMSTNNWNQNAQVHDALKLTYSKNKTSVDFVSAYNNSSDQLVGNDYILYDKNYKLMNILWLSKKFGKINTHIAGINDGYQKAGTKATIYMRYTYGGGFDIPFSTFLFQGRGFYQSGKNNAGKEIAAYYFSANLTDTIIKNFIATAGIFYASGTDATDTANKKINAFDPLYGTNHSIHGNMDYFTSLTKNTANAGLNDIYLKLAYKCCKNTTITLDYHFFMLQNKCVKNNVTLNKNLGSEIDLGAKFNLSKEASLELGYAYLMAQTSLETLSGGDKNSLNHWAYIMFTLKPKFL
ncbi:MAG: alginate export family protein [Bacteroidia bacterium]|nr:alginate export family protein [Bacteroidia bacterium]